MDKKISEEFNEAEIRFLYDLLWEIWRNGSHGNGLHNGKIIEHDLIKPLVDKMFGLYYEITECM